MNWIRNARWVALGVSVGLGACADEPRAESEAENAQDARLGTLELQLGAADSAGRNYRLRAAQFYVYGYYFNSHPYPDPVSEPIWSSDADYYGEESDAGWGSPGDGDSVPDGVGDADWGDGIPGTPSGDGDGDGDSVGGDGDGDAYYPGGYHTILRSDDALEATSLVERVPPGDYYIDLGGPWFIERFENGAWNRVEQVVLLSSRTQWVTVFHAYTSRVAYRFGVDGELIDFRAGELSIGIEIELPGEGPGLSDCPDFPILPGLPPGWCHGLPGTESDGGAGDFDPGSSGDDDAGTPLTF